MSNTYKIEELNATIDNLLSAEPQEIAAKATKNTQIPDIEYVAPNNVVKPAEQLTPAEQADLNKPAATAPVASSASEIASRYKAGAFYGNDMVLLKRGSEQRDKVKFLQQELITAGFLEQIPEASMGYMNGKATSTAVVELQQLVSDAGGKIKVEKPSKIKVFNETWSALQVVNEFGGKDEVRKLIDNQDASKLAEFKNRLEQVKSDDMKHLLSLQLSEDKSVAANTLAFPQVSKDAGKAA